MLKKIFYKFNLLTSHVSFILLERAKFELTWLKSKSFIFSVTGFKSGYYSYFCQDLETLKYIL